MAQRPSGDSPPCPGLSWPAHSIQSSLLRDTSLCCESVVATERELLRPPWEEEGLGGSFKHLTLLQDSAQNTVAGPAEGVGLASRRTRWEIGSCPELPRGPSPTGERERGGKKTQGVAGPRVQFLFIPWVTTRQGRETPQARLPFLVLPCHAMPSVSPANFLPPTPPLPPAPQTHSFPTAVLWKDRKQACSCVLFFLRPSESTDAQNRGANGALPSRVPCAPFSHTKLAGCEVPRPPLPAPAAATVSPAASAILALCFCAPGQGEGRPKDPSCSFPARRNPSPTFLFLSE